jgi:hypothetical protein
MRVLQSGYARRALFGGSLFFVLSKENQCYDTPSRYPDDAPAPLPGSLQQPDRTAPAWATFVLTPAPIWSSDGRQLLVTLEYNDERREVWRWPLDGSNPQRLGDGTLPGLRE